MRLRKERKKAKLTQNELAGLSGVKQPTISKLEAGTILRPSFGVLQRLATALNKCGRKVTPFDLQPRKQLTLIRGYRSERKVKGAA